MANTVFFKPVSITFAIIVLVESLIWAVLSFLGVLCYLDVDFLRLDSTKDYGLNNFTENLYNLYLSAEPLYKTKRLVTPEVFYPLMWIYFLLSLFLCFSSGVHIAVLVQVSNIRKTNLSTVIFLVLTFTVCIYDLITCILFGIDYHIFREVTIESAETEVQAAVILTLLILSAKGFVLWIVNFVFAILITILFRSKMTINDEPILSAGPEAHAKNFSAYNAYGDLTIDENDLNRDHTLNKLKNNRPEDDIETDPPVNNSAWFTKSSFENSRPSHASDTYSAYLEPLDDVLNANSTLPRMPRASSFRQPRSWTASRTSSFRQPRSLAASLSPSPVPPPSKDMTTGRKSAPPDVWERNGGYTAGSGENWTNDNSENENEYDEIDNVSESMSKMSSVYPKSDRFTLDEPEPDYI